MPSRPDPFVDHCLELLAPLGAARSRRMFGGHGLYVDDLFIALIAWDTLYLKADDESAPAFEAAGGRQFVYEASGKTMRMSYWSAPAEATESPAAMLPWARRALAVALRARTVTPAGRRRRKAG